MVVVHGVVVVVVVVVEVVHGVVVVVGVVQGVVVGVVEVVHGVLRITPVRKSSFPGGGPYCSGAPPSPGTNCGRAAERPMRDQTAKVAMPFAILRKTGYVQER